MTVKRRKNMNTLKLGECYINGDYYPLGAKVSFISGKFWFEGHNIHSLAQSGIIHSVEVMDELCLHVEPGLLRQGDRVITY